MVEKLARFACQMLSFDPGRGAKGTFPANANVSSQLFLARIARERTGRAARISMQFDNLSPFLADAPPMAQKCMVTEQRSGDFEAVEARHVAVGVDTTQVKRGRGVHDHKTARRWSGRPTHCMNQSRRIDSVC